MTAIVRRAVSASVPQWPADLHPVLRQVFERRALASPAELDLKLESLVPIGRFGDLEPAVALLLAHRDSPVLVVGDFDADGATSTALMLLTLQSLGFSRVSFRIPDRFRDGYGLGVALVDSLDASEAALLVTVDNGISSHEGVARARARGIDVLITDHHLPPDLLPDANVIVNPNLRDSAFPGKSLAGVGVAFYLLAALGRALGKGSAVAAHLDLVALGTVADLVRLDQSNRILVEQGIRRIRAGRCRPGIRALLEVAGTDPVSVTTATLGYRVAPRLNAAGRLDDMSVGVRCLLSESETEARSLAAELDALNRSRQDIEAGMRADAIAIVDALATSSLRSPEASSLRSPEASSLRSPESSSLRLPEASSLRLPEASSLRSPGVSEGSLPPAICLRRDDWHEGLVGLVASRVRERFHRPCFAFAAGATGELKGSGRSVPGFHLRDALAEIDAANPGLIARFGGHAMAAGLSLDAGAFDRFAAAMVEVAQAKLSADALGRQILSDGALEPEHLNLDVARLLRDAAPWGQGFPEPCFDDRFELVESRILKDAHLKLRLKTLAGGRILDAIAFHQADTRWPVGSVRRIAYRLAVNDYYADDKVQLIIEHIDQSA